MQNMETAIKRIAINFGGGYVSGLNAVITGAVLAASKLGCQVVGIRDGYDSLLYPNRYPDSGLMELTPRMVDDFTAGTASLLGTAAQSDPFHVRTLNAENHVEELERSDELLQSIRKAGIEAVISVVGSRALSILWKLHKKGLRTICIPKSVENDVDATMLSFGFNTALSFVAELLDRARQAARSAHRIAVVEVPGEHAGWLALQSGMAVCADAILIPEIRYDLSKVAADMREKGKSFGLVVVAEGASSLTIDSTSQDKAALASMKAMLSPGATGSQDFHVMERSGHVAAEVARGIQRLTDRETSPLVIGQLAKGGSPTVVDRQLGLGYGAAAVRALSNGESGVMVIFNPPDLKLVPMSEAINKFRTVPIDGEFLRTARALGISLGD